MDAPQAKAEESAETGEAVEWRALKAANHERLRNDPDREARWATWRAENADAIASWNAWVEENGLPLSRYRPF